LVLLYNQDKEFLAKKENKKALREDKIKINYFFIFVDHIKIIFSLMI